MLFASIDFKRTINLANTPTEMAHDPTHVPGYKYWGCLIDNTANAAITYVQFFNLHAADVVAGTTVADLVVPCQANGTVNFLLGPPFIFNKGLSAIATTSKGGNTSPSSAVDVTTYFEEQ